jgi:hypothetical protein
LSGKIPDFGLKKPLGGEVLTIRQGLSREFKSSKYPIFSLVFGRLFHVLADWLVRSFAKNLRFLWSLVRIPSCLFLVHFVKSLAPKSHFPDNPFEILALEKLLLGQGKHQIFRLKKPLSGQSLAGVSRGLARGGQLGVVAGEGAEGEGATYLPGLGC